MKKTLLLTALFLSTALFAQDITNKLGDGGKFYINDKNGNKIIKVDDLGTITNKLGTGGVFYINDENNDEILKVDSSGTITNKLGTNGNFYINDNSGTQLMKINKYANMYLGPTTTGYNGARTLNLLEDVGSAGLILNSYRGGGFSSRSRIGFYTNQGSIGGLTTAVDDDPIGWVDFFGYDGGDWRNGASIRVTMDGNSKSRHVPMEIDFLTDDDDDNLTNVSRMTIKSNGRVNIKKILNLTPQDYAPSNPKEGDIFIGPDNNNVNHIYCYLNGGWKQVD